MDWRSLFSWARPASGAPQGTTASRTVSIPPEHQALWQRIQEFSLDEPGAEYPFSARLADQQDWSPELTHLAIEEYKRFMFLCMVAGHMVSPSFTVDEVWHLHLQYTRSYLEDLCVYTLRRIIHHEPSKGGKVETTKYGDLYVKTLEAYRQYFGEPPAEVWGPHNKRNVKEHGRGAASAGKTVDPANHVRGDKASLLRLLS